nr:hypothetical protein [Mycolicibacterium fortuitum]
MTPLRIGSPITWIGFRRPTSRSPDCGSGAHRVDLVGSIDIVVCEQLDPPQSDGLCSLVKRRENTDVNGGAVVAHFCAITASAWEHSANASLAVAVRGSAVLVVLLVGDRPQVLGVYAQPSETGVVYLDVAADWPERQAEGDTVSEM